MTRAVFLFGASHPVYVLEESTRSVVFDTVYFQEAAAVELAYYYVGSDISAGNWTPSTGATLYGTIDDVDAPDDGDYDSSGDDPVTDDMEVKFADVVAPSVDTDHQLKYRIKADGTVNMMVSVYCGTTAICSWSHNPAPTEWTTYTQAIATADADSITDYTDLRARVRATVPV